MKGKLLSICFLCLLASFSRDTLAGNYLIKWGEPYYNSPTPTNLTDVAALAAGWDFSVALRSNGTLVAWGYSREGQTNVPSGLSNVIAIASGYGHSLALKSNGTVTAWGQNFSGQTNVPAGLSNVIGIAAGYDYSLVVKQDGTLSGWGAGFQKTNVPPELTNAMAVAAGYSHNLALKTDATVVAFGANSYGETNVPPGLSNVVAIACADSHNLALKANGVVNAWGANSFGQTNVPENLSNVVAIAAKGGRSLALRHDGTFATWGKPHDVAHWRTPLGLTNVSQIAMGYQHFVALNDGSPCIPYPKFDGPTNQVVDSGNGAWIYVNALGAPPLSYQWQFNGIEIPGASSSSLTVTNVQDINAGPYTLVISNAKGRVVSSPQFLSVTNSPPRMAWHPYDQSVIVGANVNFGLDPPFYHYGSRPQSYQWLFHGTNLPGATNLKLALTSVDSSDQGFYALVVSNAFGYATSSNAFLHVVSLPEALSAINLVWISGGDAPWFPVFDFGYNSRYAPLARSGIISNHQTSVLQTEVTGPGILDFWWRVTCEPTNDYLSFSINGVEQARITGSPWGSVPRFYLGTGKQTLLWAYVQNSIGAQYYARLDQVVFSPGTSPPTLATQPADRVARSGDSPALTVTAQGTPSLRYQWQFNQSNIAGATNSSLTLTNVQPPQGGKYRVIVTNDYGSTNSQDAVLLIDYVGLDHPKDALDRWFFRDSLRLRRVRFVGGKFVAVGDNGSLATSVDGATWTSQNTGTAAHLGGVAYGNIWSPFPVPFAGKAYIVVGSAGTILYSTNVANWTKVVTTNTCDLNDVAWNGSRFATVATRVNANQPNALVSFDGLGWEPTTFPTGSPQYGAYGAYAITAVGSRFITAGGREYPYDIWRSVGSYSWTNVGFANLYVPGIAVGNDRTVMAGWEGYPRASTNQGLSWFSVGDTNVCNPDGSIGNYFCMAGGDVAFGNGTFVIAREYLMDGLLTTTDLQNWRKRPVFVGRSIHSVAFGNGTFVALGSDGIFQSETVATPVITASRDPNSNALQLSISGEIGRQYRLQTSSLASVWADHLTYTNASGNVIVVDPISPETSRLFYRVVSP